MEFSKRLLPAKRESVFQPAPEKQYVWCGSAVKGRDGRYYLYYSFWPRELGKDGWVIHSQIGLAVGDTPTGPFSPVETVLPAAGSGWDADCAHNPTVHEFDGKYYLYYMGNYGNGEYWNHRNHQRIGAAVADSPAGPFRRFNKPLLDVTPGGCDSIVVSNPAVARMPDGRYIMVYKAVGDRDELPRGGPVVCGAAFADSPLGPFVKSGKPIFCNPEASWSVEDPYVWTEDNRLYALVKDFNGYFTHSGRACVALFESENGLDWTVSEPLAYRREILWEDGGRQSVALLERPQLLMIDGRPAALYCACSVDRDWRDVFNISFALKNEKGQ